MRAVFSACLHSFGRDFVAVLSGSKASRHVQMKQIFLFFLFTSINLFGSQYKKLAPSFKCSLLCVDSCISHYICL